ncbi:LuxR C-terminal-related transcriptional regulator [Streptomyces sp. NPDC007084]|uniref:helix-turn-helix transcriptional regulator n=1 Tax=Streptomyces sp. NPDC007084 TaxID=3154313 RepID=UPI003454B6BC
MSETAHPTEWPGTGARPFREGSAVYVPGRQEDGERVPPDEVCLSLHSLELANLGVRRALVHEQVETILEPPDRRGHPYCMWLAVLTLLYTGDLVSAHTTCRQLAMDPRWSASPRHRDLLTLMRSRISLLAGDGVKAAALLTEALARGLPPSLTPLAAAWLVEARVLSGETERAGEVLLAQGLAGQLDPTLPDAAHVLTARGALHMAGGRFRQALGDFIACGRVLTAQSVANPAVIPWRSRAAFAALAVRRYDLALALANDELTAARTWGAPRGIGLALHAVAMAGRGKDAEALLEEAVELLGVGHAHGELIHALHDLAVLGDGRGDPSVARARLETAAAVARDSRNGLWRDRLAGALDRPGQPALTSQEVRISELARAGYSNRQIAETLFLAVRTVEFHLSSVYRKLGVSGRRELRSTPGSASGSSPA